MREGELFINWNEPFSYLFEINEIFQKKACGVRLYTSM